MPRLAFGLALLAATLFAQADNSPIPFGNFRKIHSKTLGEERTLLIRLPADYEKSGKSYPVLYKLDGGRENALRTSAEIDYLTGMVERIPEHIVVGIANTDRRRDVGPGADNFARFIQEEVIPFVEQTYRISKDRILCGQSATSVFALRYFLKYPDTFRGYILSTFGLGQPQVESFTKDLNRLTGLQGKKQFFVANGMVDSYDPDGSRIRNGERFLEQLQAAAPGIIAVKCKTYENEGHVPYPAVYEGLKWIYSPEKNIEAVSIGHTRTISSKILGETRQLQVSLPRNYSRTDKRYPVLYRLDGEWVFAQTVAILEQLVYMEEAKGVPEMIVIGVPNTIRLRDMLPAQSRHAPKDADPAKFLRFLQEELIPFVTANYRTTDARILAGQSTSGFFAWWAMLRQPDLFRSVVSISPSFADCRDTMREEARSRGRQNACLHVSRGAEPEVAGSISMLVPLMQQSERVKVQVYDKLGHVPFPALYDALKSGDILCTH